MSRALFVATWIVLGILTPAVYAQVKNLTFVTDEMLLNPKCAASGAGTSKGAYAVWLSLELGR